jgi:glycosyltransferase involved in cell wall biosynthesis
MAAYTVLIPVYNEADILVDKVAQLMGYLDVHAPDYAIIICSNGSTDKTDEIGRGIEGPQVRFISIPVKGVGLAFRRMVDEAKTDKLVCIDVDLTSELSFIPECIRLLDAHEAVIGSKRKGAQERQWYRTLISGVFIGLVKTLLGLGYDDYSIGTKGGSRAAVLRHAEAIDEGSSYVIGLVYYIERVDGGKVAETPVFCSDNRGSKFNLAHEIVYRLWNLIALWARLRFSG